MPRTILIVVCFSFLMVGAAFGSCTAPQNLIEAENCNPGSDPSQWQVLGSGDSTLQGFATDISYNIRQTVNFAEQRSSAAHIAVSYQVRISSEGGPLKKASLEGE